MFCTPSLQKSNKLIQDYSNNSLFILTQTAAIKMFQLHLPHTSILSQRQSRISSKRDQESKKNKSGVDSLSDTITSTASNARFPPSDYYFEYSNTCCTICNQKYKEGDQICWSQNEHCVHAFHLDCAVDSLMNTDECMLCKRNFLLNSNCGE